MRRIAIIYFYGNSPPQLPMANKNNFPSDHADKFMVRMPEGMRDRIAELAKANNRSMNQEIVSRLEESLDPGSIPAERADTHQSLMTLLKEFLTGSRLMPDGRGGFVYRNTEEDDAISRKKD